ncbi:MAG: phosphoglycerate transporter [Chloroflexi bacterium]|nr:phosphoglycerate transporter [Chloroflexota bacterium]
MYKLGWFSTGRDKAARDLLQTVLDSMESGEIAAQVAFVFSNRQPGEAEESDLFFELVNRRRIPLLYLSSRELRAQGGKGWRRRYDRKVMKLLKDYRPDLCVLAGYMLIVGEELCRRYNMINLHPALPGGPTGTWQEVIWKLIETYASETGVMMHLVTPELDRGPVVSYCRFSIAGPPFAPLWQQLRGKSIPEVKAEQGERNPLFRLIRRHGLAREFPLIVATVKAFAEGRIRVETGKVVSSQGQATSGYDLTQEIDRMVEGKLQS